MTISVSTKFHASLTDVAGSNPAPRGPLQAPPLGEPKLSRGGGNPPAASIYSDRSQSPVSTVAVAETVAAPGRHREPAVPAPAPARSLLSSARRRDGNQTAALF